MACPSCFGLMFIGSQYCGHCGTKALVPEVVTQENAGDCPRCKVKLDLLELPETTLRECEKCGGLWADVGTFENICADHEKQSAVLGFIGERERNAEPLPKISYVPCPDCRQLMNRSNFARASGVIIDICKQHGVWFDAQELPRIINFIQKGGMEMARQREKLDIEEERSRLRDEQRKHGIQDQDFGFGSSRDENEDLGIRGFVRTLFD